MIAADYGTPGGTRTPNLMVRTHLLYPVELPEPTKSITPLLYPINTLNVAKQAKAVHTACRKNKHYGR